MMVAPPRAQVLCRFGRCFSPQSCEACTRAHWRRGVTSMLARHCDVARAFDWRTQSAAYLLLS
jgi:hypothetical protein